MSSTNQTVATQFIIVGFTSINGMQGLLFVFLTTVYLFTLCSNLTIIALIGTHRYLHVPLYYFVAILSFLEIWYTTVTVPKMLAGLLDEKVISYVGCLTQVYFLHVLGITETYLLTVMSYDRYMAICNPLRYPSIMTTSCCMQLTACCWGLGFVAPMIQVLLLSRLPFCASNMIEHIFCDFTPLMDLSCSDPSLNVNVDFAIDSFLLFFAFVCIIFSYAKIISTVLKIKTTEGRQKAFSTCGAHLTVVFLFFGSVAFVYIKLTKKYPAAYYQVMAVVYSVLTPMCNPIIYSLRNREIKDLMSKQLKKILYR